MSVRTKPPIKPRRVAADGLTVEAEGELFYPHVGEWVEFKGRPSVGLFLKFAQLGDSPEALSLLLERIHAWNWTDDEGTPYPNPPTLEALMSLPKEELGWLIANVASNGESEEERKNGSGGST